MKIISMLAMLSVFDNFAMAACEFINECTPGGSCEQKYVCKTTQPEESKPITGSACGYKADANGVYRYTCGGKANE